MNMFEGSFLGDGKRIGDDTIMECGVCWWVYDPSQGDEVWQVPPGTAFTELSSHWRCPHCDAAQHQFMVLRPGEARERPATAAGETELATLGESLQAAYQRVAETMRPLPVYNAKLDIQVVGNRRCAHGSLAVVATPWSMNLLLLPLPNSTGREGSSRELSFPSGSYSFIAGHLEGVGVIETCSLFSPMAEFDDPAAVTAVAEAAIEALFTPTVQKPSTNTQAPEDRPMSRRSFLRAGSSE